jgi:hypothetical protein
VGYVQIDAVKAIFIGVNKFSICKFPYSFKIWMQPGIRDANLILLSVFEFRECPYKKNAFYHKHICNYVINIPRNRITF